MNALKICATHFNRKCSYNLKQQIMYNILKLKSLNVTKLQGLTKKLRKFLEKTELLLEIKPCLTIFIYQLKLRLYLNSFPEKWQMKNIAFLMDERKPPKSFILHFIRILH